ncbi:MAG: YggS family pyridoxal phosphate-dependent enzyme [Desulfatiglans sp.]|nr:YggS family pyridoxal phosphate-dependent enzyme [Desulfatiglans sp.]
MIQENVKRILEYLPGGVELVGAAKTRTIDEISQAVQAGLTIIGENYVQEAEQAFQSLGKTVRWHMIGHLQSNKVNKAVKIFDMIETVDSVKLAGAINKASLKLNKTMPILIEINSGEEHQKAGVMPSEAEAFIRTIATFENIKIMGLMTMGPYGGDPEDTRLFFNKTRTLFQEIRGMDIHGVDMQYLSMGMSNSYKVAIEEGANLVRIGTEIFGERVYR